MNDKIQLESANAARRNLDSANAEMLRITEENMSDKNFRGEKLTKGYLVELQSGVESENAELRAELDRLKAENEKLRKVIAGRGSAI